MLYIVYSTTSNKHASIILRSKKYFWGKIHMNKSCTFEITIAILSTSLLIAYLISSLLPNIPTLAGILSLGAIFLISLVFAYGKRALPYMEP